MEGGGRNKAVITKNEAPMKFLQDWASLDCLQFPGHAIRTVLCFIPPSPADWMRWEKPSRRLDDTTTWQKPLVRSAAMTVLMFWTQEDGRTQASVKLNAGLR